MCGGHTCGYENANSAMKTRSKSIWTNTESNQETVPADTKAVMIFSILDLYKC